MKKLLLAAFVVTAAFFTSCNSGGSDPKAVLISFFDAMGKKDVAAARKLATTESKAMLDQMEKGLKENKETKNEEYNKDKMEFGEAKIEGDKATVPVKEKATGETTNFTLKKQDGAWKVAFDKESIMNMAMEKMKEKNPLEGLDKMKDMNADTLKNKALEEAGKVIDSLK